MGPAAVAPPPSAAAAGKEALGWGSRRGGDRLIPEGPGALWPSIVSGPEWALRRTESVGADSDSHTHFLLKDLFSQKKYSAFH